MHDAEQSQSQIEDVTVTERVNGWWVTVRHASGHQKHHGPYIDEESARVEADLLDRRSPADQTGDER